MSVLLVASVALAGLAVGIVAGNLLYRQPQPLEKLMAKKPKPKPKPKPGC